LTACGGGNEPADAETEPGAAATEDASEEAGDGDTDGSGEQAASFPVEIEHAYGTTEITEAPQNVVTWGWGSTEAAIAVGVHPVGMTEQVWTVGEGGHLPWIEEAVTEAGEELPTLLTDDFTAPPYEEIIALEPDLILAPYSG